jgi:DNA repair protein RecO (recombination protein O)
MGHASESQAALALLLRRVSYGESDVVVTLFTDVLGRVSALARGARASRRRFSGTLEPMHTLRVRLAERASSELLILSESSLAIPRRHLTGNLASLEAAGRALGWIRHATAPHSREPRVWGLITNLLDQLDRDCSTRQPEHHLAHSGLALLGALGWGLELDQCVTCGRACSRGRSATIDPVRGGLVCRTCGGGPVRIDGPARHRITEAIGGAETLLQSDTSRALLLVEQTLRAHASLP